MTSRSNLFLTLALLLPALALGVLGYVLVVMTWSTPKGDMLTPSSNVVGFLAVSLVASLAGSVVALKRPENLIGWLFLCVGFFGTLDGWFSRYLLYTLEENPASSLPSLSVLAGAVSALWIGPMSCTALLLLLFPQGRPVSPRWRIAAWAIICLALISVVVPLFNPGPLLAPFEEKENPLGIDAFGDIQPLANIAILGIVAIALAGAVSLFRRFVRSTGDEREQIKWFAYSALWLPPILIVYSVYSFTVATSGTVIAVLDASLVIVLMTLPVAVGIAVVKYRLYDIDFIVSRTLVYVPLTAILAGLFTATTGLFRALFTEVSGFASDTAVAMSTLAVVAFFTPVKNQLQSLVDRHFREPSDPTKPLVAMATEARRIFSVLDAEEFLQEFADNAAAALTSTNALVYLNGRQTPVVVSGDPLAAPVLSFPLIESGTHVGRLEIGASKQLRPLSPQQVAAIEKETDVLARGLVFYAAANGLQIERPDQTGPGVADSMIGAL